MAQIDIAEDRPVAAGEARDWHWNPELPVRTNPFFAWPPRPLAALKWSAGSWLAISSTLAELLLAVTVYLLLQPSWETVQAVAPGWIAQIWLRNLCLIFLVAGGLHLYLYRLKAQGEDLKFDPNPMAQDKAAFTFRDQVHDNMFWTLASGVTFWTCYEVLIFWSAANGWAPLTSFEAAPVWFPLWFFLIPIWASAHFYWVHRALHWPPLYRLAHSLHHRNVNVGPWTGISMHPIEHLLYFSSLLIHLVVLSHPVHILFHCYVMALNPATSHSGYDGLLVGGRKRVELGDFFHQLHHRYFVCNFGTSEMPWDRWFGSFHNGTPEATKRVRANKKKIMGR